MGGATYEAARVHCVRLAGVPLEVLEGIATPSASIAARGVLEAERQLTEAMSRAARTLAEQGLERGLVRRARQTMWKHLPLPKDLVDVAALSEYRRALEDLRAREATLAATLEAEERRASAEVWRHALEILPRFLVIESDAAYAELARRLASGPEHLPESERRAKERKLVLYLQRVCAKNDTMSRFGPLAWGRLLPGERGFSVRATGDIARTQVTLERWVVVAIARAMDADPDVRPELAPRVHPNGAREGDRFVRLDLSREVVLDAAEQALLARCDGVTPAHALAQERALERLAAEGVILWQVELPAWDTAPLTTLTADVAVWRPTAARDRWAASLAGFSEAVASFACDTDPPARRALTDALYRRVEALGGSSPDRAGKLYAAANPFNEECVRACDVTVGGESMADALRDAAPWLDLFRVTYSLAATRAYDRLEEIFRAAPLRGGEVSLPGFLALCRERDVDLRGGGLGRVAAGAFEEVRDAFRALAAGHEEDAEWSPPPDAVRGLCADRVPFLVEECSMPSADLQIRAASPEAAARGELEWVVGELHSGGFSYTGWWCCPDPDGLRDAFRDFTAGHQWLMHTRDGFDSSVHIAADALPELLPAEFVAPERPKPGWRVTPPSEVVVRLDEAGRDLRAVSREGRDLGSLVHNIWLFYGFHPFVPFVLSHHTPRLRLGKTIVQRRSWQVTWDELATSLSPGVTAAYVTAVERLRAARGIPRWVFLVPHESGFDRTAVFRRHKDLKPLYIDLESYHFIEIFVRRLERYGAASLTEMSPAPDEQAWREPKGTYCFELRTVLYRRRDA